MNFNFKWISGLSVALVLVQLFSCTSQEPVPQYINPNQTDSTGNNVQLDLFVSGEIENVPFTYYNGVNGYANWTISSYEGICVGNPNRFNQVHTTAFLIPERLTEAIYIDIKGCVNNDSNSQINAVDSVLNVGNYTYAPRQKDFKSAAIRYIDSDSVLWATTLGANASSFVKFELSALVPNNYDTHSKHIAFGKFEGYLYNGLGDSLRLKVGSFKGRIVQ